jgi:hypothetical protein
MAKRQPLRVVRWPFLCRYRSHDTLIYDRTLSIPPTRGSSSGSCGIAQVLSVGGLSLWNVAPLVTYVVELIPLKLWCYVKGKFVGWVLAPTPFRLHTIYNALYILQRGFLLTSTNFNVLVIGPFPRHCYTKRSWGKIPWAPKHFN